MEMNDELLIKFLLKETSEGENTIVEEWLSQSEENSAAFIAFEKIWKASKLLAVESDIDADQAWTKFKNKIDDQTSAKPIVKPLPKNYTWLKIAAVFLVAIGSWSIYNLFGPSSYTDLTSTNAVISKILPDGSELIINKNSQISYAGNFANNRKISLKKGEVFFKVAHDKSHPFVIEIANVAVEVVGTSFNIKHLKEETEVVVESGVVKVRLGKQELSLVKGERININPATKQLEKQKSTDVLYNYYRTQLFIANNTPLPELISILNEAYNSDIVLNDKLSNLKIYTTLEYGNLDENLRIICDALSLKITRNEKQILLSYP